MISLSLSLSGQMMMIYNTPFPKRPPFSFANCHQMLTYSSRDMELVSLTHLPVFVMIISVPTSSNCLHSSSFSRVTLTLGSFFPGTPGQREGLEMAVAVGSPPRLNVGPKGGIPGRPLAEKMSVNEIIPSVI